MRLEFVYIILAIILAIAYFAIQKKYVFGQLVHGEVLLKGMNVDIFFQIVFTTICLLILLTINGVKDGMEIKNSVAVFSFLLRTPIVRIRSMFWMNVVAYILQTATMIVGLRISSKSREHKNLALEKKLNSDRVVCIACAILATLEILFCFLRNIV